MIWISSHWSNFSTFDHLLLILSVLSNGLLIYRYSSLTCVYIFVVFEQPQHKKETKYGRIHSAHVINAAPQYCVGLYFAFICTYESQSVIPSSSVISSISGAHESPPFLCHVPQPPKILSPDHRLFSPHCQILQGISRCRQAVLRNGVCIAPTPFI